MDFTPDFLALGVVWYVVFLFSITVHEAAHALAALKLGDDTAYQGGQVTLNPLPHIQREPFGTIVLPMLSYFFAGWMMGMASAPYDPQWADRYPRRAAWMALAGPASNLLIAVAAGLLIRIGMASGNLAAPEVATFRQITEATEPGLWAGLATVLSILFSLNVLLCAFNLLPIPPLDGSGALPLILKQEWIESYRDVMGQIGFFGILLAWYVFGEIYPPIHRLALNLLYPELVYG